MKTKLFLFAAMLLMSVSAFAQSDEPLQGDVNGDGKVDVADITAIIAIIKANAEPTTTYYWYVGIVPPTDPNNEEQNSGLNKWTVLSDTTSPVDVYMEDPDLIEHPWYLAAPNICQYVTSCNGYQVGGWTLTRNAFTIGSVSYDLWTSMDGQDTVNTTLAKLR